MSGLDWAVLVGTLATIVLVGLWRGRQVHTAESYLRSGKDLRWWTIGLSIIATQASAITFLSVPGQGYEDGLSFVQFYFGLPIAMVLLSAVIVPIYHRLQVYTAYEYLEKRFDRKTRQLVALLFLVSRGLASGLALYAPALVLSAVLGWPVLVTNALLGATTIALTVFGGSRAVARTQTAQMTLIFCGLVAALVTLLRQVGPLGEALHLAGALGKLNAVDTSLRTDTRYTLWSGLFGGLFVQLAYFGTDQSQVQRYLSGGPLAESRLGLLMNGLLKVPMQLFILFVGVLVFVFYQAHAPPLFFHQAELERTRAKAPAEVRALEDEHARAFEAKSVALRAGDLAGVKAGEARIRETRARTRALIARVSPGVDAKDSDFIFLRFVLDHFPRGVVGLLIAVILSAALSANSAALSSLGQTTVIDFYRPLRPGASDAQQLLVARLATAAWGAVAIAFAGAAAFLDNLIQAVNVLGSLFYGPMLGVFVCGFFLPRVRGTAAFVAVIAGELCVLAAARLSSVGYLWYNVIGCAAVVAVALVLPERTT